VNRTLYARLWEIAVSATGSRTLTFGQSRYDRLILATQLSFLSFSPSRYEHIKLHNSRVYHLLELELEPEHDESSVLNSLNVRLLCL